MGDGTRIDSSVLVSGLDYRIDSTIGGDDYAFGRNGSFRWRRTPAGVVRIIASDVQGDDADRWPLAWLGFDTRSCATGGETPDQWVLHCRSHGGVQHWYYVDKRTGRVDREISREGSRVIAYSFDSFGAVGKAELPWHWTITGAGGNADVRVIAYSVAPVSGDSVAIPASTELGFQSTAPGKIEIPATFSSFDRISVPVSVDGHAYSFVLDTGTTQVLMDVGAAARAGLRPSLGHAVAQRVDAGGLTATNLPIETVNLFNGDIDGLLGNEFFIGHIVHIDFPRKRLEVIPRATFVPPSGALEMPANFAEGMPLLSARAGSKVGDRFALDVGSNWVLLAQPFLEGSGDRWTYGDPPDRVLRFLEGPLTVRPAYLATLGFGPYLFQDSEVAITQNDRNNLEFPLDGIFGLDLMSHFEWWFDYDGGRLWLKPNGS